jgi:hypothetical protein
MALLKKFRPNLLIKFLSAKRRWIQGDLCYRALWSPFISGPESMDNSSHWLSQRNHIR